MVMSIQVIHRRVLLVAVGIEIVSGIVSLRYGLAIAE